MAVEFQDYYATLGVARGASADEVRTAFRKLARQYHPDVNKEPGAADRFKQINEAYEVLSDPQKRAKYDQFGVNWQNGQEFNAPPGWGGRAGRTRAGGGGGGAGEGFSFNFGSSRGFSDFFEAFFGGDPDLREGFMHGAAGDDGPSAAARRDIEADVDLSIADAITGGARRFTLTGSDGAQKTIEVKIPAGVTSGDVIRLSGQGRHGGDLRLRVRIASDPRFTVEGHDVRTTLEVSPWEAALGAKVEAITPSGPVTVSVPAGTGSGARLRLRGRGLARRAGGAPGDLIVDVRVAVPKALTDDQRRALEAWRESMQGWNPRS